MMFDVVTQRMLEDARDSELARIPGWPGSVMAKLAEVVLEQEQIIDVLLERVERIERG